MRPNRGNGVERHERVRAVCQRTAVLPGASGEWADAQRFDLRAEPLGQPDDEIEPAIAFEDRTGALAAHRDLHDVLHVGHVDAVAAPARRGRV